MLRSAGSGAARKSVVSVAGRTLILRQRAVVAMIGTGAALGIVSSTASAHCAAETAQGNEAVAGSRPTFAPAGKDGDGGESEDADEKAIKAVRGRFFASMSPVVAQKLGG